MSSGIAPAAAWPAKKDRHIVTWSQQEDDLLREQIAMHGTDNWAMIAAQFKDKTSRQCRRRWYNYLNSECKKGGWSQEEDMLLCEAQKVLGNRWTEIAKLVSGRTDNAVKNRFSTLCKKRAKHEASFKENNGACIVTNTKRVMTQNGSVMTGACGLSPPNKQMRSHIVDLEENGLTAGRLFAQQRMDQEQTRQPLAVISPNFNNVSALEGEYHVGNNISEPVHDAGQSSSIIKSQGTFLKKDDPKFATLLQQAELLSSLATKVNAENTSQIIDEAWKQLQDYLNQIEENRMLNSDMLGIPSLLEDLEDLIHDVHINNEAGQKSLRQIELHEQSCSAYERSMEATSEVNSSGDQNVVQHCPLDDNIRVDDLQNDILATGLESYPGLEMLLPEKLEEVAGTSQKQVTEFASPVHTVPTFQSFADGIPSPKFTESERNFLLSVFAFSSPASGHPESSQQPSCKRALIDSL